MLQRAPVVAWLMLALVAGCATAPEQRPRVTNAAALAEASACAQHYLHARIPRTASDRENETLYELYYEEFATLHSSVTLTPLWSAEILTGDNARAADRITRRGNHYAGEPRATPRDYTRSGFDRGHMTPADDMPSYATQAQTFTMANMAPQAPRLNQRLWRALEGSLHVWAERNGDLHIVTGPVFSSRPSRLNDRVATPSGFFKAVYDSGAENVVVFYARNRDDARCEVISLNELEQRSGIDPFPSLRGAIRDQVQPWALLNGHTTRAPACGT